VELDGASHTVNGVLFERKQHPACQRGFRYNNGIDDEELKLKSSKINIF
jgi:hypothetical protein